MKSNFSDGSPSQTLVEILVTHLIKSNSWASDVTRLIYEQRQMSSVSFTLSRLLKSAPYFPYLTEENGFSLLTLLLSHSSCNFGSAVRTEHHASKEHHSGVSVYLTERNFISDSFAIVSRLSFLFCSQTLQLCFCREKLSKTWYSNLLPSCR